MIEPYFETDNGKLYHSGCLNILKQMPDESIDCVVTSPPYWGLRDYSTTGQIGLEPTIQEYIDVMTEIFSEVKRVLKNDGTLWLNMGDSYCGGGRGGNSEIYNHDHSAQGICYAMPCELKPKDLIGMPWRVAFALQDDGWYLRSDIIWHKPNPMPESVTDRPTKAHEYIFLMSKSVKYYYDAEVIAEPQVEYENNRRLREREKGLNSVYKLQRDGNTGLQDQGKNGAVRSVKARHDLALKGTRNKRTVWTIPTQGYSEAHFATYPVNLIFPCIKAGCRPGGIVLDPFMGSGTTAIVAEKLNQRWAGIEINLDYAKIAVDRIKKETAQYKLEFT